MNMTRHQSNIRSGVIVMKQMTLCGSRVGLLSHAPRKAVKKKDIWEGK